MGRLRREYIFVFYKVFELVGKRGVLGEVVFYVLVFFL